MDTCVLSLSLLRTPHVTARGVLRLVRVRDQLKRGERGAVARDKRWRGARLRDARRRC
jgi:hypothetical protein